MVPAAVFTQSKPVPITAVRPVCIAVPKIKVTRPRHAKPIFTKTNSPKRRYITRSPSSKVSKSPLRVTAVKASVVSAAQGVIDSGCLRHMTENMSYLSDLEELNGGYVAFGGNPKGDKIFGKGKIRTGKLDFDDVYFGKQHRASCKTKPVSFVDQPLYRLHRDLFGPTFVRSLNKKSYCLVVTDDYSRSDNGIKFKNSDVNQFCGMKGIKREFSVPRTPQQNGIAKRKNRTLIEAARTMLNRVLVTKPHNKAPYELLHGITPSISFMRPFGCPVTILNTLDSLGKFNGKADEGFLVGYSVSSKAFRVFNSRTRIVQETLHVNFLENKPNVAGSGPTWLFDNDSLTQTMNYQPVTAGNQSNPSANFQDKFDAKKAKEECDQQYVLFPVWSSGSTNSQNTDGDAAFDGKEPEFDKKKPGSKVNVSPSSSAQSKKQDDKTKREAKGKSPVESFTGYKDLSTEFEDYSEDNINEVNAAGTLVPAVGQNFPNSTNTFSAAGPSNAAVSPTHGKSSFIDASQLPNDLNMPELEDITYSDDEDDVGAEADFNNLETSITVSPIPSTRVHKDHHVTQISGDLSSATQTKIMTRVAKDQEPKRVLLDLLYGKRAIGTKWVFRNKKDKRGIMVRNKARLVTQGHTHEEGIDDEEVFSPVARIEAIRSFLAYASFMGFMVYQIDVKSTFLYETIEKEVYVCQPLGFEDPNHPDKVYKVVKALYGLHQAPRAWYETLANYLLENEAYERQVSDEFNRGTHILFGSLNIKSASTSIDTEKPLLKDPDGEDVDVHTYRSMIGSLMYLTSSRPDIMFAVCACACFQVTPKASHLHAVKRIFRYLNGKPHLGLWYPKDSPFDLVAYSDRDYIGASLDRKSTTRGCQFLGCRLISWQCKKQTIVATSSTEAEYVVATSCYAQVLWIQNQLLDYGYNFMHTIIYIDNSSLYV
nr:hypothetical protein [Tanacetum cinerariifolium]